MCLQHSTTDTDKLRLEMKKGRTTFFKVVVLTTSGKVLSPLQLTTIPAGTYVSNRKEQKVRKTYRETRSETHEICLGIHVLLSRQDALRYMSALRNNPCQIKQYNGGRLAILEVIAELSDFVGAGKAYYYSINPADNTYKSAVFMKVEIPKKKFNELVA